MPTDLAALREAWELDHGFRRDEDGVWEPSAATCENLARRGFDHGIELAMAEVTADRAYLTFDYPMHEQPPAARWLIDRDDLLARLAALKGGA